MIDVLITGRIPEEAQRRVGLQQFIRLTGLSSPMFDAIIRNIHLVQMEFERQISDVGHMEEWKESNSTGSNPSIDISNRYFTPEWQAKGFTQASSEPSQIIDPAKILTQIMADKSMLHLDDNMVTYYRLTGGIDEHSWT